MSDVFHIVSSSGVYGAERSILGLIKSVSEYKHRVICFNKKDGGHTAFVSELERLSIPVDVLSDKRTAIHSNAKYISNLAGKSDPLFLHGHGYKGTITAASVKKTRPHTRVLCTQHGFTRKSLKTKIYSNIETKLIKGHFVDHVICVSKQIYDYYRNVGVDNRKLQSITNAVEIPASITSTSLGQSKPIDFLYLGRLSPEKGPDLLIRALQDLSSLQTDFSIKIAGNGPLLSDLQEEVSHFSNRSSFEFLGFVSDPDSLIRRSKWLVLPSRTEGLPMAALEAMARGTPVIATSVGELPNLITNKSNGILVEPNNVSELTEVLEYALRLNDDDRMRMANSAHNTVLKDYSLERYGREIADIYDRVFEAHSNLEKTAGGKIAL